MTHKLEALAEMFRNPWTWYFVGWFAVCAVVYITGDKWKR